MPLKGDSLYATGTGIVVFDGVSNEVYARACKERDELKAELERLILENKEMKFELEAKHRPLSEQVLDIQAKLDRAVDSLEWYANVANYNCECAPCYDKPSNENGGFPHEYDEGERARECLKLIKGAGQ